MLTKKELIQEEKECAAMLGIDLKTYKKSLENIKAPKKEKESKKNNYDNTILKGLGINESMLKKKSI